MKNYFKLALLLVVASFFLLTNCEKEDQTVLNESQLEEKTPLVLKKTIPFNQSLHLKQLETKVDAIKERINNFNTGT